MADGLGQPVSATVDEADTSGQPTKSPKAMEFSIGLTMAGAISAGAYTAGVLDFLVEALEEWEAHRGQPGIPAHRTGLKVVAGASAGAITGALGLIALARGTDPKFLDESEIKNSSRAEGTKYNPLRCVLPSLFATWVEQPQLVADTPAGLDFLDVSDLAVPAGGKQAEVASVLNSKLLDRIKDSALRGPAAEATPRPYVASETHLYMTVSNLRGIPFEIGFGAGRYGMQTHGDRFHYRLEGVGDWCCPGNAWLNADRSIQLEAKDLPVKASDEIPAAWNLYGTVALASAAFPIGLASRLLETEFKQYDGRSYPVDVDQTFILEPTFPGMPADFSGTYKFLNVDGGLINNNPFDYAEYALLGRPSLRRPPDRDRTLEGLQTDAALIMIAPFPEPPAFLPEGQPKEELSAVLRALLPTLMTQARFRANDLAKALDPEDYSRYLVAPQRLDAAGKPLRFAIACGALGGFGGFLDRGFRAHDYQLGRRNCQEFLRHVFGLPVGAAAVDNRSSEHQFVSQETKHPLMPVIPLMGAAALEIALPHWPRISEAGLDTLGRRIEQRLDKLLPILIRAQTKSRRLRLIASAGLFLGKRHILDAVRLAILSDLIRRDQVEGWALPDGFSLDADDARAVLAELASPLFQYRTISGIAKSTHLKCDVVQAIIEALKSAVGNVAVVAATWDATLVTLKWRAPAGWRSLPVIAAGLRKISPPSRDDKA